MEIALEQASAGELKHVRAEVCSLVRDAVEAGASIGFVPPLADDVVDGWVGRVIGDVERGERIVVLARDSNGVLGMVQLALVPWPNGTHRAEVQKLIVHSAARRRGLGTQLMNAIEATAREHGRTLLVLDTITASEADPLYRGLGYMEAGEIPDYAGMPDGVLAPTTVFYKHL